MISLKRICLIGVAFSVAPAQEKCKQTIFYTNADTTFWSYTDQEVVTLF